MHMTVTLSLFDVNVNYPIKIYNTEGSNGHRCVILYLLVQCVMHHIFSKNLEKTANKFPFEKYENHILTGK